MPRISIIIPAYNEETSITGLVQFLLNHAGGYVAEIIVSDGGSTDSTQKNAADAGATALLSPQKGRAAQMNYAASLAIGDILYFVHADTLPPGSYARDIIKATENGYAVGRYRTKFDSKSSLLKLNAFFTRFDIFMCYGGDQTLFITKKLFDDIGGFNEAMMIMEDYDITERARKKGNYAVMKNEVLVSARKYETNGWLKVQKINYTVVQMYRKGATQKQMSEYYKNKLSIR